MHTLKHRLFILFVCFGFAVAQEESHDNRAILFFFTNFILKGMVF